MTSTADLPYAKQAWFKNNGGGRPRTVLTEAQVAFIDYLVDPTPKPSQAKWAEENGVSHRTLTGWKKQKLFREEWERKAYEVYGNPERVGRVVEALYVKATEGDVKAMQLYLQYVDKFTPKREVVNTSTKALADLSDGELEEALKNVVSMRERRETA